MTLEAATHYRLLTPRATLTGLADSLANIIADPLPDGALCWVLAEAALWRFAKHSTAAPSATVIATSKGTGVPGRWIQYPTSSGGGGPFMVSSFLFEPIDIEVAGPVEDFQPMSADLTLALPGGFDNTTAILSVNSTENAGFGIGLRITYTLDNLVWVPLPGSQFSDTDSTINRRHLTTQGTFPSAAVIGVRGEWTAFGDSGTWSIPIEASGACITAWQFDDP